ncbi:multicopper oxidase domain-containing protein [Streptomyces sp. HUAS TT20]|uniref:multicopper oxidase domain-containing protein n=1 Tax=Streptomyces sp. HUAS TT20 TaxID=3447509 RepID=UPI0021D8AB04|nr:multicopper oxidase domain-containing protein [Streptomyces sp. HUAS 15-9]UXY25545.1 multicopper oxidase domain-containing protein [Streptomyces sp. HUAS 15-9]
MITIGRGPAQMGGPSGTAKYPSRFRESGLRVRHLRAHVLVVAWFALALLAAAAQQSLPVARWLAVHLFLLGGATTAILIWSEHFAVALLHAQIPDERWSDARLAGANVAVTGILVGVWADLPVLTGIAGLLLVAVATAHLVVLIRMGRGALGGRLKPVVGYYRIATAALIAGAVLGGLLATGHAGADHYAGLRLAHIHVTLLGWIGLPILGTLFMLWPTVLGVRMKELTTRVSRWVLWLTGSGLSLAAVALALQWQWPAVAGLAAYASGAAVAAGLLARTVRGNRPVSVAAAWMLAAATCWLLISVTVDLVMLAARSVTEVQTVLEDLVPVLLVGFVAQVLFGALTYLLPVVLSRGHEDRAAVRAVLERGWLPRLVALNAGVALLALPLPGPCAFVGMGLVGVSAAAFLVLVALVLAHSHRTGQDPAPAGAGPERTTPTATRRPALLGTAAGVVITVLAVLVANGGQDTGGSTDTVGGGSTAGTRTVNVTIMGMSLSPKRIEVTKGTSLRLKVTNKDAQRHDLKAENGPATPLLSHGQTRTLDIGKVTADLKAWCTLPGHRAAGMEMDIVVKDGTGTDGSTGSSDSSMDMGMDHSGHSMDSTSSGGLDLSKDFSKGWTPRSAELPAAGTATVHKIELHAAHRTIEVAPGVKQRMWTFGGTAPGPTLHGRIGDIFEITLVNDDTGMGHGIDFHAGALSPDKPMRTINPGERLVYRFRAERAGAWLYHCSTMPMLQHMGNGMYGAVIIDPPGLPKVDHEYALVSSEIYLGTPGSTAQLDKMRNNTPDAWVFNGIAAQYDKAMLKMKAGERARFWVVAAGPSDGIAFHIVGTIFDTVYKEGAYLLTPKQPGGSQALDLSAAQGGFVETTFAEAGHYAFVDHDMRHAEAGAHGMIEVTR